MAEFPYLEIFLGLLGGGLLIMFCTTFCMTCKRIREEQIEREVLRRSGQNGRSAPIYVIPLPRSMSQPDSEDHLRVPRYSQAVLSPPNYSTSVYCESPPAYNELGFKPEDLPPGYTEYIAPVDPTTPTPHTETPQTQSQQ